MSQLQTGSIHIIRSSKTMPRPLQYLPETEDGFAFYEITNRCIQSRFLLRPGHPEGGLRA